MLLVRPDGSRRRLQPDICAGQDRGIRVPPTLLAGLASDLNKLRRNRLTYAVNVQYVLNIAGRSTGMSRLNSGHFGRRAAEPIRHHIDRHARFLAVSAQLDAEAPPANGGAPLLIHFISLSVDHLIVQDNGSDKTNNHGRRTCNLHRHDSWCNLFRMARVTAHLRVMRPSPAQRAVTAPFAGVRSSDRPGWTDPLYDVRQIGGGDVLQRFWRLALPWACNGLATGHTKCFRVKGRR